MHIYIYIYIHISAAAQHASIEHGRLARQRCGAAQRKGRGGARWRSGGFAGLASFQAGRGGRALNLPIHLSIHLSINLSVCLSICYILYIYLLSVYLSIYYVRIYI